jgi:hypothetical protein
LGAVGNRRAYLVVVGDWDGVMPPARAQAVFSALVNAPQRRLVQIDEATHIALMEKNRPAALPRSADVVGRVVGERRQDAESCVRESR